MSSTSQRADENLQPKRRKRKPRADKEYRLTDIVLGRLIKNFCLFNSKNLNLGKKKWFFHGRGCGQLLVMSILSARPGPKSNRCATN